MKQPHETPLPGPTWEDGSPVYYPRGDDEKKCQLCVCPRCELMWYVIRGKFNAVECSSCGEVQLLPQTYARMLILEGLSLVTPAERN